MQLTPSQSAALEAMLTARHRGEPVLALSGPAGTGKTTMISALCDDLHSAEVCTPTNKAAQVLCHKGLDAATFFRRFYILEKTEDVPGKRKGKPKFISCQRFLEVHPGVPLPDGKLARAENLIIDEASMVTTWHAREMRKMCDTLILVGDKHQLPPVGDDINPAGFFCGMTPTAELTEVLRQTEGSLILNLATEIRTMGTSVNKMVRAFEPQEDFACWVERGAQSIAFTNKERQRINAVARSILGRENPWPMPGDVMVSTSNYSDDLLNGTTCTVIEFDWDGVEPQALVKLDTGERTRIQCRMDMMSFIDDQVVSYKNALLANFQRAQDDAEDELPDAAELTYGYCLTAHKAQGSEWEDVVVFDQRGTVALVAEKNSRSALSPEEAVRRWFYTAVTRAKKNLIIAPPWYARSYSLGAGA